MDAKATAGGDRPRDVESGEPSAAELTALSGGALVVALTDVGFLRLGGADRVDFLHGQVSHDVRGLRAGEQNRSLLLNHRGHALAEMRVLRGESEIEVAVEGGALQTVEQSLRAHIIFDQVELTRPAEPRAVLTVQGPGSEALLAGLVAAPLPGPGRFTSEELAGRPVTILRSARTSDGGFDLHLPGAALQTVTESLVQAGALAGSREALELARVCAGLPAAAAEGGEGILPQEAGLEPLVSYRKGCYLGQEIMARIEARGKLRRELGGLLLQGEPEPGERDVLSDGRSVGRIGTVSRHPRHGFVALAVLRTDLAEGAALEAGGAPARRVPLPLPL
jgi:folate-binding protein YgfZ